jgi:hypothetical protein
LLTPTELTHYTYDVNTNTNYNAEAEIRAGCSAMDALARYLGSELIKVGDPAIGG